LLHTLVLVAQEHGAGATEEHNPLLPQTGELIYGIVAFGVLYFLLWKLVFPPLNRLLEERRANIEGRLEQAELALREAEELRERRRAQLEAARDEATAIVERGRRMGEETRQDIVAQAEAEAARKLSQADAQIAAERERAIAEVRTDVGELAVQLAERIVGEAMDAELQQRVVGRFVEELATGGNGARGTAAAGAATGEERGGSGG
jgi:F-type H+-transporting ATPase subunit b